MRYRLIKSLAPQGMEENNMKGILYQDIRDYLSEILKDGFEQTVEVK